VERVLGARSCGVQERYASSSYDTPKTKIILLCLLFGRRDITFHEERKLRIAINL